MRCSFLNSECEHVSDQTKGLWLNAAPPTHILEPDKKKIGNGRILPPIIHSMLLVITSCTFKFQLNPSFHLQRNKSESLGEKKTPFVCWVEIISIGMCRTSGYIVIEITGFRGLGFNPVHPCPASCWPGIIKMPICICTCGCLCHPSFRIFFHEFC